MLADALDMGAGSFALKRWERLRLKPVLSSSKDRSHSHSWIPAPVTVRVSGFSSQGWRLRSRREGRSHSGLRTVRWCVSRPGPLPPKDQSSWGVAEGCFGRRVPCGTPLGVLVAAGAAPTGAAVSSRPLFRGQGRSYGAALCLFVLRGSAPHPSPFRPALLALAFVGKRRPKAPFQTPPHPCSRRGGSG